MTDPKRKSHRLVPVSEKEELQHERNELLHWVQRILEWPMIVLGFVWLGLLLVELVWDLTPFLEHLSIGIWVIFVLDFLLKLWLAPEKLPFLKHNVLTIISLVVPALRVFRIASAFRALRSLRAVRGIRLVKVVGSINRGMRSLSAALSRRAFGYVMGLSLLVLLIGGAGMYAFEKNEPGGFSSYWEAVWWTSMLLTSLGSDYWPQSPEGRLLCILLGIYGFAVFGYFTATLATFFIGRDADNQKAEIAGSKQIQLLHQEIAALREDLRQMRRNGQA